jgi:acyl dehydratase
MGMNRAVIGKEYPMMEFDVNPKDFTYYALASNDTTNPYYWDESRPGGIIAPPMFAVVFGGICIPGVIFDKELGMNVFLMVHGEEDIRFYKPVKAGMKIKSRAKIVDIIDKGSGELCQFTVTSWDEKGEKVAEALTGFFVRGGGSGKKEEKKPEPEPGKPIFETKMKVLEKQTYIYAWASGDHNFIHVNPEQAVKIGKLPGIILQGLCTMAFCQNAVIDALCKDRNPELLKRLAVRFAKPVFPKDELTITGWEISGGSPRTIGFEAKRQDGTVVVKNGIAEVA